MNGFGFVGRDAERAAIAAAALQAADGQSRAVWIEGAAGSGKSALLRSVVEGLPPTFTSVRAEADELAGDVTLEVATQLGVTQATAPFEAGLELLDIFGALQDAGPVAVIVEDLHWADPASRLALLTAGRRLSDDRVLLVTTSRPDARDYDGWDRFVTDPDRCLQVGLGALSVDEVLQLATVAGIPLSSRDAERLHQHTGGHALYVRTLLAELSPEQLATPDRALPAPRSLASTTVRRLVELPPDGQMLGSALAVLNHRAPLELAARVGGIDEPTAALESLLSTGFVAWSPSETGTPVEFVHPLYRTAVYDDLPPTRRRDLHLAAADALGAEAGMAHRVAGAHLGDEALATELAAGARSKAGQGALSLASRDLMWAWSISADRAARERYLLEAAWHLLDDGQIGRVDARRAEIEACAPSPLRSLVLGSLARSEADAEASVRLLTEVRELVAPDGSDEQILAVALARLAGVYATLERGQEAIDAAREALAIGPEDPEVSRYAWASMAIGEGLLRGGAAGLALLAERIDGDPAEIDPHDAELLVTRSMLAACAGHVAAAVADVQTAIRSGRISNSVHQRPRAHLHLGQLLQQAGDLDLASTHIRIAASLIADERHRWLEAQVHGAMAMIASLRGEWVEAEAQVDAASAVADEIGTEEVVFAASNARGALARARGDNAKLVEAMHLMLGGTDPAVAAARLTMMTSLDWWPSVVHALIETGDTTSAIQHIELIEVAAAERQLDLDSRLIGLRARVAAAEGRPDEAAGLFAESLATRGPDDPIVDRGIILQAYGQLLFARGARREAIDQLRAAHELFAQLGAEPYRARVQADLERIGIHAAPADERSPLALTAREQDVASLVATGMTNKEVAAELYVSSKAVEYHLRNIFGKLGIGSRRELRARLAPA